MKNIISTTILLFTIFAFAKGQNDMHAKNVNLPCINKIFFLYLHVCLDSTENEILTEAKIKEILNVANKAFEPICISFNYCKIDYIRDYSFLNIKDSVDVMLLTSRFQKERRLNVYIVENVFQPNINSFSTFKGITDPKNGNIIIPKSGLGFIHELGSTFGLLHTFETKNGIETVDGKNCITTGDLLCDTPADPFRADVNYDLFLNEQKCNFQCTFKDSKKDFYKPEIGNYMTHYFCAHCFFTTSQYLIMAETYLNSQFKMW